MADQPETTETSTAEAPAGLPTTAPNTAPASDRTPEQRHETLRLAGGSQSPSWNNLLINQTIRTCLPGADGVGERDTAAMLLGLVGIAPKDEIEAMLGAQMLGLHNASMEAMRRGMVRGQTPEGYALALSQANKASRTFATLVEALNRYRGKSGQQKVTVEHVHVHAGGQAIVGAVDTGGRGAPGKPRSTP